MAPPAALICACLVALVILVVAYFVFFRRHAAEGHQPDSLYTRLGGVFAINAVVDYFSDEILKSPLVGVNSPNPQLRAWSQRQSATRLPGLKFMRSLWVCDVAGGPFQFHSSKPQAPGAPHLDLRNAHRALRITPAEFDEVARILAASLDHFHVPAREKGEVLGAFLAHKAEVTAGSRGG